MAIVTIVRQTRTWRFIWQAWCLAIVIAGSAATADEPIRVLLLDGHNPHHDWQATTPVLTEILRSANSFVVEVGTAPPEGQDMSGYRPPFDDYNVVVSNYNSQYWDEEIKTAFVKYLRGGGGFVCVHAASNAFADWPEYNEICGLGGWYGRDERSGPYVYYRDDKLVRDDAPGPCGHHGPQHEFQVRIRDEQHPITRGLPPLWMHAKDELYDQLRGPAKNIRILATAYADPAMGGTDRHEPILMALSYGDGRVFHTMLGHADYSMRCVGFATTFLRGTQWAATAKVTIPAPDDFPTDRESRSR